jgi:hypothetical protein
VTFCAFGAVTGVRGSRIMYYCKCAKLIFRAFTIVHNMRTFNPRVMSNTIVTWNSKFIPIGIYGITVSLLQTIWRDNWKLAAFFSCHSSTCSPAPNYFFNHLLIPHTKVSIIRMNRILIRLPRSAIIFCGRFQCQEIASPMHLSLGETVNGIVNQSPSFRP